MPTPDDPLLVRLRTHAAAGDPIAARELGRLLALLPADPTLPVPRNRRDWPAEPWLRAALAARPEDPDAAVLLAGLLVQQIEEHRVLGGDRWDVGQEIMFGRVREAANLYASVLRSDPHNRPARTGSWVLTNLWEGEPTQGEEPPAETTPNGFYLFSIESYSGAAGEIYRWLAGDPDELRWAVTASEPWMRGLYPPEEQDRLAPDERVYSLLMNGDVTLSVGTAGRLSRTIDLTDLIVADEKNWRYSVDWDAIDLPPLAGDPLPPGQFVVYDRSRVPGQVWEQSTHYGFSVEYDI